MQKKVVALVGPSNCGKTTLINELVSKRAFRRMISVTTRPPRESDPLGEYEYVTEEEFERRVQDHLFAWTTGVHGGRYGTLRSSITEALNATGGMTVMHLVPGCVPTLLELGKDAVCLVFITCQVEDLERRIRQRDPGRNEVYYQERIESCLNWENEARSSGFPYVFIKNTNGNFDQAFDELISHCQSS